MERSVHAAVLSRGLIGLRPFQSAAVLIVHLRDCINNWLKKHSRRHEDSQDDSLTGNLHVMRPSKWQTTEIFWRINFTDSSGCYSGRHGHRSHRSATFPAAHAHRLLPATASGADESVASGTLLKRSERSANGSSETDCFI